MTDISEYVKVQACKVSERLNVLLNTDAASVVSDAMRYSAEGGGKRIRPVLTLEFSRVCDGNLSAALDFGCAVEMIHTYSLIHDDLPCMDDDDMRRGKPSCHIAFGEDNALLAGDALLTKAFSVLSGVTGLPAENIVRAVGALSDFAGIDGMVGGQVLDLQFENTSPTAEEILKMYSLKTCALLKVSAVLGCLTAENCSDDAVSAACEYGENIGLAFQIVDDILDIIGDSEKLGKPIGSDTKNDKSTLVSIYGINKAKELADELTEKAISALDRLNGDTHILKEIALMLADRTF
ncbi:MAG: polyprenyl synthetase family protein [Oscillospiraceae bacterium]|nr:polyprenyl synthetase family protein [Oscillospiraceae bacterium]